MTADKLRELARDALGLPYPSLGTEDPVGIAKAQAYALLAIAEELRDLRIDLSNRAGAR